MKSSTHILFFLGLFALNSFAQNDRLDPIKISEKIDVEQNRIDLLDGIQDIKIAIDNKIAEEKAQEAYFTFIDFMQTSIVENTNLTDIQKYNDLVSLYNILQRVGEKNYFYTSYFYDIIENAYGILNSKMAGQLELYVFKNTKVSIQNIQFFKDESIALQVLKDASKKHPNEVLKAILLISNEVYAKEVVEYVCGIAPNNIKQYFSSSNVINRLVLESNDSIVNTVIQLYLKYNTNSKVFLFLDKIMENPTPEVILKYDLLYTDKEAFFRELIEIRKKPNPLAEYNIEQELKVLSLDYIRPINEMHLMKESADRFKSIDHLSPEMLYTMMVYTPEEIFTSTFNGIFERLIKKLDEEHIDRLAFLQNLGFNRFRTFIKLCSGYNTLNEYLKPLESNSVDSLFKQFTLNLEHFDTELSEAVDVADTFGSIEEENLIAIIAKYLHTQHQMMIKENKVRGEIIYGLLLSLIENKTDLTCLDGFNKDNLFVLEGINNIPSAQLYNQSQGNLQIHYFYDDEDGIYSFSSFIQSFKSGYWKITDSSDYVVIQSTKGLPVSIFANKPSSEREGQQRIKTYFENNILYPDVLVHRGHSYYANISIEGISPYTSIVFLGSCGSYHNLTNVVNHSEIAHIVSSKQIGTAAVNNIILKSICEEIREGKDVVWEDIWKALEKDFKSNKYDKEKFVDYIPPHKNLGALFIKTFRELTN